MFSAEEVQVLLLSLRVAFCCVLLSLLPAVLLGWLLARREFPLKIALDGLCHLPLVLPPVVTGYLLLLLFGRRGLFGPVLAALDLQLAFDWKGAVLASAVVGFPLMLRSVRLGIESVDPRLERVARTLGAGPVRAFLTVTLRLAAPGLLVGSLLTFARSLGEFGANHHFCGQYCRTDPHHPFGHLHVPQPTGRRKPRRRTNRALGRAFAASPRGQRVVGPSPALELAMLRLRAQRQLGRFALDVDIECHHAVTAIYGPSGAGKTSLLNLVAGLVRPDAGEISLDGQTLFSSTQRIDLPPEHRRIGYVFQDDLLFPHLSTEEKPLLWPRPAANGGAPLCLGPDRRFARNRSPCSSVGRGTCPAASASALPWAVPCSLPRACC